QKLATSRALAATSIAQLAVDPEISVALASEAYSTTPTTEAEEALRQSLLESHAYLTIPQHKGRITRAAFSPDGKLVVVATGDSANIWDLAAGSVIAELHGHSGPVVGAAFSPNGKLVVTASDDKTARIWDWKAKR